MSKYIVELDDKDKEICEQYINGKLGDELGDYVNVTELADAIAQSTPYNPSGDSISRSGLKEDFKSRLADCNEWIEKAKDKETKIRASAVKAFIAEVIMTIDNALTVDIKDQIAGAYNEGYMCGSREAEKARPQGEWKTIEGIDGDDYYECSNCGEPWVLMAGTPKDNNMNFCPNCGAKMKGGAE